MPRLEDLRTSLTCLSRDEGILLIQASQASRNISSQRTIRERTEKAQKQTSKEIDKLLKGVSDDQAELLLQLLGEL